MTAKEAFEAQEILKEFRKGLDSLSESKLIGALDLAIEALGKDTNVPSTDTISRQDVIELVKNSYYNLAESMEDTWAMVADVERLPSAQPELIRCEDCYWHDTCKYEQYLGLEGYCSKAER